MKSLGPGLDRRAVIWIGNCTLGGTAGCTAIAMLITYCCTAHFGAEVLATTLSLAFYIPVLLGVPLFALIGVKIQQLALTNRLLIQASRYDGLTGCLNRGAFTADVIDFFAKQNLAPFPCTSALLILDADHFKKINDCHGHLAGDAALVAIAAVLRDAVGEAGVVGRLGGEEFAAFVRSTDATATGALAERIRLEVAEDRGREGGRADAVTVSIGIALFTYPAVYEDIFRIADDQLYLAKGAGRNCVSMMEHSPRDIRAMAEQLRRGFAVLQADGVDTIIDSQASRLAGR
ncbi:GGDEF domain-containing protein [Sinorhizobium terangae]|uniref:diguanylate cyclase n=1 Tax=Sinorhizobium terangae TaxID=110322 RepID=A0A6N7L7S4_SINTE|nr:GGDEF domain-containing protein [Sinorhizobium terangae]MBB4185553.1 diguanylate cyclase (GGDEF)-like protein [Sinorhizobium terangae]MQX13308.1 diguanylate cyclase [Sinorhizobium terangae]WFU46379.1 GGDEF domain-containing protein [Sinorhizobium terangae]